MAQVKLLKIAADGVPLEMDTAADEITLFSGQFGNVKVSGNDVISTNTNGDINITPNGTGSIVLDSSAWPQNQGTAGYFLQTNGAGQLTWVSQADDVQAEIVGNSYIADEALSACDAVYISAADNVSKALADNNSVTSRLMGFAKTSAADTAPVIVVSEGVLAGFSGMTAGNRMYLSPSVAGGITSTIPVGTGHTVVQAGYAKSATALHIHIEQMGRRA